MADDLTPPLGTIPSSAALAEVSADSLSDLFSKDPERFAAGDLDRMIGALREQRARWESAEAAGGKPRAAKPAAKAVSLQSKVNAEDLGLF